MLRVDLSRSPGAIGELRTNQGGVAYAVVADDPYRQIKRFLHLGAGETLYKTGAHNSSDVANQVINLVIKGEAEKLVDLLLDNTNVARQKTVISVYAMIVHHARNIEERKMALAKLSAICRIPTHWFTFLECLKNIRQAARRPGKGMCKVMKAVFSQVYHSNGGAARQAVTWTKYKAREGWAHEDILRLIHPKPQSFAFELLFTWFVKGKEAVLKKVAEHKALGESIRSQIMQAHQDAGVPLDKLQLHEPTNEASKAEKTEEIKSKVHTDEIPQMITPKQDEQMRDASAWFDVMYSLQPRRLGEIAEESQLNEKFIQQFGDDLLSSTDFILHIQLNSILNECARCAEIESNDVSEILVLQEKLPGLMQMNKLQLRRYSELWCDDQLLKDQYKAFGYNEIDANHFIAHIYSAIYRHFCPQKPLQLATLENGTDKIEKTIATDEKDNKDNDADEDPAELLQFICDYESLKEMSNKQASEYEELAAKIVRKYKLTTLHLPSAMHNNKIIMTAVLETIKLEALMRELPRLTRIGLISDHIIARLSDKDDLKRQQINPLKVLIASKAYRSGRNIQGSSTWLPDPRVCAALEQAFENTFASIGEPTGKHFYIGLDVSGSMGWSQISNMQMNCAEAGAALVMMLVRSEPHVTTSAFSDTFKKLDIRRDDNFESVMRKMSGMPFAGTRIDVPILEALNKQILVDTFLVITDNDMGIGTKPSIALAKYNKAMKTNARLATIGMVSNGFTIAEPNNPKMLDIVGFDTATLDILRWFAKGEL